MGTEITNYRNSVIIGHDIIGSSNSFYFGKTIENLASSDTSYNFLFGNNLTIDSNATNFRNNLVFGSGHTSGGDHNLIFGNSLTTNNDVSYCVLLGNGSGNAQLGDLIKYFEDGSAVFQIKSGGNMLLTGDISANDASFNNVVFSNIGNENSKIKLVFVKGISAENISIENALNMGGDLSGNDASFNNIDFVNTTNKIHNVKTFIKNLNLIITFCFSYFFLLINLKSVVVTLCILDWDCPSSFPLE